MSREVSEDLHENKTDDVRAVFLPPGEEIAGRAPDVHVKSTERFTKVFVESAKYEKSKERDAYWAEHKGNMEAMVNELINLGLRADGDVKYEGSEPNAGSPDTATDVTYSVPVVLARHADNWNMSPTDIIESDDPGDEDSAEHAADKRVREGTKGAKDA